MLSPKERLSHLMELAARGAAERSALAAEVADLLLDWPPQYPAAMRATFETLLEKIVREMAAPERAGLAVRFEGRNDVPLALLSEFFLDAPKSMKTAILARHEAGGPFAAGTIDCEALLLAARSKKDFAPALAGMTGVPEAIAQAACGDAHAMCVLAKGAGVNRATFSAIAILTGPLRSVHENFAMLTLFDHVSEDGARGLVAFWRAQGDTADSRQRAAE